MYTTYNCLNVSPGVDGAPVTYTVPAEKYISLVSQADANAKAVDDIFLNGQTYANQNGVCIAIYYNAAQSVTLTKSCSTGYVGTSVTYTVPAGKYSSTVSQAAADAQATADINANGQNYANTNGTCRQVVTITTRNPNGLTGYWVWLVNTVTGEQYDFAMPTAAQTTTIQVPTGTYNLTLTNPNGTANLHSFMAGCTGEGIDGTTLSNVSFYSGCSTVAIN